MNWLGRATWSLRRPLGRARCGALTLMQRVTCWTAVVLYATLSFGFSIPAELLPISGEAFPCMNHGCGCHTADQCWHDCCCMSLPEKLVWARENKVTPPSYVLDAAQKQGLLNLLEAETPSQCCCCQHKVATPCCATKPNAAKSSASCCSTKSHPAAAANVPAAKSKKLPAGVSLLAALKCHGAADSWTGAPVSLSPPPAIAAPTFGQLVAENSGYSPQFVSWAISPPTPPPRCS